MDNNNFSKIGNIIQKPGTNIIKLNLDININIRTIKFIFLSINNDLIPFKVLSLKETKKQLEITLNNIDTITDSKPKKINVFLTNDDFNKNIKEKEDANIINFYVVNKLKNNFGYVSIIYNYPMNKCIEITHNSDKYLIPYNKAFVKKINIKEKKIEIHNVENITKL